MLAILASRFINEKELIKQLTNLQNSLSKDINLSGLFINLQTKIGIYSTNENTKIAATMLKKAFQALDKSKRDGLDMCFYQRSDTYKIAQKLTLATELQQAIKNNELELYHQPQINLTDASVHGSEVLLRWHHPVHGFIPPGMFIRITEDTGIINELTMWVLNTACQQLSLLIDLNYTRHNLSINISGRDVASHDF